MFRREFLHAGALTGLGLGLADSPGMSEQPAAAGNHVSCILLFLDGGPSQLDTWDMKPEAPSEIRGPYRPIKTNVPGIEISEIFPRMAKHADKFAIIRSCYHTAEPVHHIASQAVKAGLDCLPGTVNYGGIAPENERAALELHRESAGIRDRYGRNRFGQSCLAARRQIEAGARLATVNMFDTVTHQITWDIHGFKPFSPMNCYRNVVGPMFDMAYSTLLSDLDDRGLLSTTMVLALGEFGRTPRINPAGGRDHWPECWSMLMAGGPIRGGQVLGSSDATASAPKDRPVSPEEIAATVHHGMGIPSARRAQPIRELFA